MVLLPALVFCSQVKGSGVLEVRRQNNGFVTSFTGKLHSEVPRIECNEGEIEVLGCQVFGGKRIEAVDCVAEGSRIANVFPCESCQARCGRIKSASVL